MKLRLIKLRDKLADSFWFLPALMAIFAAGSALGTVALDHGIGSDWVKNIGWVWSGGADGARAVLSVIAGSVMTVVSIVFSLTISTLSQNSAHYGPRVLRNFTSDRRVQFTLGTFIATFVYCLLVLRTVRSVEETGFVPYLAVNIGVLLALASLAVLIFFIHYVSQIIQAENLIADVGRDFQLTLPILFPDRIGENKVPKHQADEINWEAAQKLKAKENGYLLRVDDEQLMDLATEHDLILRLEKRPGEFVARDVPLLRVLAPGGLPEEVADALRDCYSVGRHRTPHQDALYSLQQLVEIAAHALSPGINEPFTAQTCIDWLGASLRGVMRSELPLPQRYDGEGNLRVLANPLTFDEIARTAFEQIRIYGANNPAILVCLLNTIESLAPDLRRASDRDTLRHHAEFIRADATQIQNKNDQERVTEHVEKALHALAAEYS
ncbi:MAG: DUF2254 domain-containing protein [Chthoniobacter sp.]|uniref:DUF2254 domain-containing protein n=1 Tax=Chthoniobacter sp. TaxID=2510640 RepID=UPI0032A18A8A